MSHLLKLYNRRTLKIIEDINNQGTTLKDLCKKIDLDPNMVTHVRGGRRSFTVEQITTICKYAKVSADWVLGISTVKSLSKKENES